MSDLTPDAPLSTTIDTEGTPSASGAGTPAFVPSSEPSAHDTLTALFNDDPEPKEAAPAAKPDTGKDAPKDGEKADPKPVETKADKAEKADNSTEAKDEKPATPRDPTGKFAPKEKAEDDEPSQDGAKPGEERQNDGRRHVEAPRNFLPKAKELWRNTPAVVQQEVERLTREHETELQQHREASERYSAIRDYDELARSNGRDLKDSLAKVVEIENALAANPIAGLNRILQEVGPRKPDGQPISLYEVAAHIVQQGPEGYQRMVSQQPQAQQPQVNPEVESLKQELSAIRSQMTAAQVIEPFARENPRYYELQDDIAFFLNSGKIPNSLNPVERLAAAYDMAERINPPSHVDPRPDTQGLEHDRRADDGFSGSKSIKSAPGAVSDEIEAEAQGDESARDTILKELRRLNRS